MIIPVSSTKKFKEWNPFRGANSLYRYKKGCYSFFDGSGNCLYIGMTKNLHARMLQHISSAPFFKKAKFIALWLGGWEVTGWEANFLTLPSLSSVEDCLIGYFKPKYNKTPGFYIPSFCCARRRANLYYLTQPSDE